VQEYSERRPHPLRRAGLICVRCGAAALLIALVTGFGGMARKDSCLSQSGQCSTDVVQTALIVLYFGSLIVLAACIVLGVVIAASLAFRIVMRRQSPP
jgi:hypothetical protein